MTAKSDWNKNIVLFLASQTLSLFGSSLVQYAIMWYITLNTQSGLMMTISIICGFVPTFFLSPFAGVWADRYNRKLLIVVSDSMIALSTLVLAVLFLMGYDAMWLLFVASALRALGTGVQTPAVGAFIPQLVAEDKLTKVNGLNGSIQALVMLVSPMLSGALLTFASIEAIFFIDVVTAAIAVAVMLIFLHVPVHAKAAQQQTVSYYNDLRLGFTYIKNHNYIRAFFTFCAFFFILAAPVAFLTPLQVNRSFGEEIWRLTAIEIAFSLGMMSGGLFMASWGGFRNRVHTMTLASVVIGAGTFALGWIPVFWIYLLVMGFVGVAMPMFNTPSTVMLQEKVEPDYLGRVFGVMGMISSSMMPLGMLVFGPMADYVRIEWMLIGTGLLLFIQGLFLLTNKVLLKAGEPAPQMET
ncbi:MFS transporter [Paenibacillus sp. sgz500958]|uniref:MFS transporter n=1 Tax=Paenibacillus sp. sgz500958 TaxID=3242475 RepID=UPI0036D210A3